MPSFILIHPAVWPQQTWTADYMDAGKAYTRKFQMWGGCRAPFHGRAGSPSNTVWPGPRPTRMPSFILIRPTVWPQYSNVTDRTGQTGQRSDGIGRTVFGRPFVKRFALCHRSVVCLSVLTCVSVTFVHCGQTVGRIKTKLGKQVGLIPGHMVLDGDPAPLPKKGAEPLSPIFGPCPLWPNGWMDRDGT